MNKRIIAGCVLLLGMVWFVLADEPPRVEFRLTPPILRSLEPAPNTTPSRKPVVLDSARMTPTEPFTLTEGTYTCVPYTMIVVVPAPMDEGMIKRPGTLPATRTFQPPATFVPVPH